MAKPGSLWTSDPQVHMRVVLAAAGAQTVALGEGQARGHAR